MSNELNNTNDDRYDFNFIGWENLEIMNGHDIFMKNGDLYALVWEAVGITDVGYNSRLLIKKKNDTQWSITEIPGKAYYLGDTYNNEICSIKNDMKSNTWDISFYDLEGKILSKFEHKYKVFSREYYHYEPVPLCYEDGSLIFYTIYTYETRNIVSKALLNVFGGHGSLRGIGEAIEIVPALINKKNKRNSFSYFRVTDSSGFRQVIPINKNPPLFDSMKKRDFTVNNYKVSAYELEDKENNYYLHNNKLIKTSDKIEIADSNTNDRIFLPMPPIDDVFLINGKFKYDGHRVHGSDIWAESEDVFLAIREENNYEKKKIIIYHYDIKEKKWSKDTTVNSGYERYRILTIYKENEYLYLGLWGLYEKFKIVKYKIQ